MEGGGGEKMSLGGEERIFAGAQSFVASFTDFLSLR
jgi:hypothetical protein